MWLASPITTNRLVTALHYLVNFNIALQFLKKNYGFYQLTLKHKIKKPSCMKSPKTLTTAIAVLALLLTFNIEAQKFSNLDKSPMDAAAFPTDYKVSDKLIKIVYSRPQLKGRELSKLAPNGKVWRTGANEAPELTLYTEMKLGNTTVKPGTYTFYVIPRDNEWTAIISKDINVWGSYFYDEANDVARLSVPVSTANEALEAFSIAFEPSKDGVHMHLGWGNTRIAVPFTK